MTSTRTIAGAVLAAVLVLTGCSEASNTPEERRDEESDRRSERPTSTGAEQSTTTEAPPDGSLQDEAPSTTTLQGADPGQPPSEVDPANPTGENPDRRPDE